MATPRRVQCWSRCATSIQGEDNRRTSFFFWRHRLPVPAVLNAGNAARLQGHNPREYNNNNMAMPILMTISNTNRELVTADRPNRYDPRCIWISSLCFDRADFYAPCRLDGQSGARRWRCALRRRVRSTRRTCPKSSGPARRTSDYAAHNKKRKV